jgi:beta-glucosidase
MALHQLAADYYTCVVASINAGVDMVMVPYDYQTFITTLHTALERGDVALTRIEDAVRRILRVKFALGLFENPYGDESLLAEFGSAEHRAVAREAVRKSLVLLKNEQQTIPLAKDLPHLLLAGNAADDIGLQCGGWTIEWQGKTGAITQGTSIRVALQQSIAPTTTLHYHPTADFAAEVQAEVGIAVLGEAPYAEGMGDTDNIRLTDEQIATLHKLRAHCQRLVLILVSGRPLIITEQLPLVDAFIAAWWFGTEALGVTDVLFGEYPFSGTLSYSWLRHADQLPLANLKNSPDAPLWAFGAGIVE